jgi:hypothetical protein
MTQDIVREVTESCPRTLTQRINQIIADNEDMTLQSIQIISTPELNNIKFHAFMHLKRRIWGK